MKFLLVLLVVLFGVWVWRSSRARARQEREPEDPARPEHGAAAPQPPTAIDMVDCAVCGVHSPRTEAVAGRLGHYCSVQHRDQAES